MAAAGDDAAFRGDELPPRQIKPVDFLGGRGCEQPERGSVTTLREVTAAINEALEIVGQICDQERQGRPLPAKLVFYISSVITELVVSRRNTCGPQTSTNSWTV